MSDLSHISISDQEVIEEITQQEIAPWISIETREIKNPNLRFHNEIIDFFDYIRPKK